MTRLWIDGVECAIVGDSPTLPAYDSRHLRSVEAWREGESMILLIGATPEADSVLYMARDIYRTSSFNDDYHEAIFEVDGTVLFRGVVTLLGTSYHDGEACYRLLIRSGGAQWAKQAATTRLNESAIEYNGCLTLPDIEASWDQQSPVRFMPLWRDRYPEYTTDTGIYATQATLMPHDYYPFLAIEPIIDSLVKSSDYTLVSSFMQLRLFKSLMMSGAYRTLRSAEAYATMGFKAYRTTSTTNQADDMGRVYAWLPYTASNIGCIVDTVSPTATDEQGDTLGDAYNYGNCFTFDKGRPIFRPRRTISTAFDMHLRYTTDYRIVSSSELRGFDTISLGGECVVKVKLSNPFVDQRSRVVAGTSYRVLIFDHDTGCSYMLDGYGELTDADSLITATEDMQRGTRLLVKGEGESQYSEYTGDWAIYFGYVTSTGSQTVAVDIRTDYRELSPSKPELFNAIFFAGAEPGQSLTLHSGCSVTPVFNGVAGFGSELTFSDVANVDISQADLMEALMQMFNLCIYSDDTSRRLYVEPYDSFFTDDIHDWQHRQIDEPHDGVELRGECYERLTLGYQPTDGIGLRSDEASGSTAGSWSYTTEGYASKQATHTRLNPLFAPTLSLQGMLSTAPAAEVMCVGDRDALNDDFNISPRVVIYRGLMPLPEGQTWGAANNAYPYAYFHSPQMEDGLGFEVRDNSYGLHRYHLTELEQRASGQRLCCRIVLHPDEYRDLFDMEGKGATLRSLFRLRLGQNSSLFRLEAITHYDYEAHIATCSFIRTLND